MSISRMKTLRFREAKRSHRARQQGGAEVEVRPKSSREKREGFGAGG